MKWLKIVYLMSKDRKGRLTNLTGENSLQRMGCTSSSPSHKSVTVSTPGSDGTDRAFPDLDDYDDTPSGSAAVEGAATTTTGPVRRRPKVEREGSISGVMGDDEYDGDANDDSDSVI